MRNRRSLFIIIAGLLAVPTTSFAMVPTEGVSVSLPGVGSIRALEICTEVGGSPSCKKVATPALRRGRISARWNRSLGTGVTATPVSPYPAECHGRPGARINASVVGVATDISLTVQASYAGVSTPRTVVSVKRKVRSSQGAGIWACLL